MARKPLRPLIRSGGFYPSRKWTPLVYAGGYTTANGGEEPAPPPIEKTITGNPIHILDALAKPAQALSVKLEPVQDLNGYSYPWPAGGGKNLLWLNNGVFKTGAFRENRQLTGIGTWVGMSASNYLAPNNIVSYTIGDNNLTVEAKSNGYGIGFEAKLTAGKQYTLSWVGTNVYVGISFYDGDGAQLSYVTSGASPKTFTVPESTANAIIVLRADNANVTGEFSNVQLEEGQTATAYSPYANICPISGWSEVTVEQSGKNLFDPSSLSHTSYTVSSDGSITVRSGDGRAWSNIPEYPLKAGTYTISATGFANNSQCQFRTSEDSYDTTQYLRNTVENSTFTLTSDGGIKLKVGTGTSNYPVVFKVQIESGSTATTYTPYNPSSRSISISLGQTVYGGTLDVTAGTLTVDRAYAVFDGSSDENWRMHGTIASWFYADNAFTNVFTDASASNFSISNAYKQSTYSTVANIENGKFAIGYSSGSAVLRTVFKDTRYTTVQEWTDALATNHIQLCYKLATPQTIQLTPQQVELLLGENNIWSDGEMTLTYLADGNASDEEALNILLGGRYVNNHDEDEPTDREALNIILGGNER